MKHGLFEVVGLHFSPHHTFQMQLAITTSINACSDGTFDDRTPHRRRRVGGSSNKIVANVYQSNSPKL